MSLDGLRAWIGVVERKLAMRTRVFLVLVAIAVGGAGAAIYLALDAQDSSVSQSELQQVRDEAGTTAPESGAGTAQLEAEVRALQEEVAALRAEGSAGSGTSGSPQEPSTGGVTPGTASGAATVPKNPQQLEQLVEKAKDEAEKK